MLIGMRALQGIGAGGLTALGTVLIADIISPRERGQYMGLMGAVMGLGMVGGPLLGGVITDGPGWRWNFFVGLPVAIGRDRRAAAHAAPAEASEARREDRLPGRGAPVDRHRPAPALDHVRRQLVRVGVLADRRDGRRLDPRPRAGHLDRDPRGRADHPAAPVQATAPWSWPSSPASPSASPCSAPRCSSASTCSWPAARRRPQSGLLTIPMIVGAARLVDRLRPDHQPDGPLQGVHGRRRDPAHRRHGAHGHDRVRHELHARRPRTWSSSASASACSCRTSSWPCRTPWTSRRSGPAPRPWRSSGRSAARSESRCSAPSWRNKVTSLLVSGLAAAGIDPSLMGGGDTLPDLSTLPDNIRVDRRAVVRHRRSPSCSSWPRRSRWSRLVAVLFLKEVPLGNRSGIEQLLAGARAAGRRPRRATNLEAELDELVDGSSRARA